MAKTELGWDVPEDDKTLTQVTDQGWEIPGSVQSSTPTLPPGPSFLESTGKILPAVGGAALRHGVPLAAGLAAAAYAAPAGPMAAGAAFGTADEAAKALIRWGSGEEAMPPEKRTEALKNVIFSAVGGKLAPAAGNKLIESARSMTGAELKGFLGLLGYGAGEAAGMVGAGNVANVLTGQGLSGSGENALNAAAGMGGGMLGKYLQTAMRNAPESAVTQSANALQIPRGQAPGAIPELLLESPDSAKMGLSSLTPGKRTEGLLSSGEKAVNVALSPQFAPLSGAQTKRTLADIRAGAAGQREVTLDGLAPADLPAESLLTGPRVAAQHLADTESEATARKIAATIDPELAAQATPGPYKGKGRGLMNDFRQKVGQQYGEALDTMETLTGDAPITSEASGKSALNIYNALDASPVSRDSGLFRTSAKVLDSLTGGKRMSVKEARQALTELEDYASATEGKDWDVSKQVYALRRSLEGDIVNAVKAQGATPEAQAVLDNFNQVNEKYRNAYWANRMVKEASGPVGRRMDPSLLRSVGQKYQTEMTPGLQDAIQKHVTEFAGKPTANLPATLEAAQTSKGLYESVKEGDPAAIAQMRASPQLENEVVDRMILDSAKNVPTGAGDRTARIVTSAQVKKFVESNPQIAERLSPTAQARLTAFIDSNQTVPASAREQLKVAKMAATGNPMAPNRMVQPGSGISPETLGGLPAAGTQAQKDFATLALRGGAAKGGQITIPELQKFVRGLRDQGIMQGSPTREMLEAVLAPDQMKMIRNALPLLENLEAAQAKLATPINQAPTTQARQLGSAGSYGSAMAGAMGAPAGVKQVLGAGTGLSLTGFPQLTEYLIANNWSPEAQQRVQTIMQILKTRGQMSPEQTAGIKP